MVRLNLRSLNVVMKIHGCKKCKWKCVKAGFPRTTTHFYMASPLQCAVLGQMARHCVARRCVKMSVRRH
eukprot:7200120-Karenia_brevis.AAC.1